MTEKRRPLTRAQIAEITLRQLGKCARCSERLDFATKGAVIDEHLHPLADGGTNETDNRAFYCKPCAKPKTAKEARDRGKSKRIAEGRTQADRRAQRGPTIKSRGFDRTLKRRMDGTVTRRDA
jgi:5-methylcytosine-specific restriction endonuclease McrA